MVTEQHDGTCAFAFVLGAPGSGLADKSSTYSYERQAIINKCQQLSLQGQSCLQCLDHLCLCLLYMSFVLNGSMRYKSDPSIAC